MTKKLHEIVIENILKSYETSDEMRNKFLTLMLENPLSYFDRNNNNGHITSSMFVINADHNKVLLTHHKKFNAWLQLGGHNDLPGQTPLETSIREMLEEGFDEKPIEYQLLNEQPIDIDMHFAVAHYHYDMCFLAKVKDENAIVCSFESNDVAWKTFDEILEDKDNLYEDRLRRIIKRVKYLETTNFTM